MKYLKAALSHEDSPSTDSPIYSEKMQYAIDEKLSPLHIAMYELQDHLPNTIIKDNWEAGFTQTQEKPLTVPFRKGSKIYFGQAQYIDNHDQTVQTPYVELSRVNEDGETETYGPVTFYPVSVHPGPVFLKEPISPVDNSRKGKKLYRKTRQRYANVLDKIAQVIENENVDLASIPFSDYASSLVALQLGAELIDDELEQRYAADEGNKAGLLLIDLAKANLGRAIPTINILNPRDLLNIDAQTQVSMYRAIARSAAYPNVIDLNKVRTWEDSQIGEIGPKQLEMIYEALLVTDLVKKQGEGQYLVSPLLRHAVSSWTRREE